VGRKDFSFIVTGKPIDSTAKAVLQKGESCPIEDKIIKEDSHYYSDSMPEVKKFTGPKESDLTGKFCGHLLVVGYIGRIKNCPYSKWACRCKCGKYVIRKSKSLKNGKAIMCDRCSTLSDLKNGEYR
jgi:hypothetical protein